MHNMQNTLLKKLPQVLLPWYEKNARSLPWRETKEPYHIWLSEIMLQQTRVEAVKSYYTRFLEQLPTISALANAEEPLLLKLWEGLGYYSRVRNLQKAARIIEQNFGGVFPQDFASVLSLPGIGEYTAGAICSICFGKKTPAVDGNVVRVLSRILMHPVSVADARAKKQFTEALKAVYPEKYAGDFTQSLMELGATVCVPNGTPLCDICPARSLCKANAGNLQKEYPLRTEKKPRRLEKRTVFLLICDHKIALLKRPNKGLLAGLWEFPNVLGTLSPESALKKASGLGAIPTDILLSLSGKHIFTHIEWDMTAYCFRCEVLPPQCTCVTAEQLKEEYALPTAFRQFADRLPPF